VIFGLATGIVSLFIAGAVVVGLIKAALLILSSLLG
jgi:hypothetical protein